MNVAVTTAAEGFPRRAFTVEDIGRMIDAGILGEDEKFELVEGEIVMAAAWQKHTIRGFISILGSKSGMKITSSRRESDGARVYEA